MLPSSAPQRLVGTEQGRGGGILRLDADGDAARGRASGPADAPIGLVSLTCCLAARRIFASATRPT
jgi:hypothetical protein